MAYRQERIARAIERIIANALLFEVKDASLTGVTVTKVMLNKDYSVATIFWTTLEGVKDATEALEGAKGFLRTEVAHGLSLYKAPELRFRHDDSYEKGARIDALLAEITDDRKD